MRWSLLVLVLLLIPKEAFAWCVSRTCKGDDCPRDDEGCLTTGDYLSWSKMPVEYRFDDAGSDLVDTPIARQVIRRAFSTWENVDCENGRTSLQFHEGSEVWQSRKDREEGLKQPFAIYFRDKVWPYDDQEHTLAKTTFTNWKGTGNLHEAAMEINTNKTKFALTDVDEGVDLQAVITHEVGHWIGIAHSGVAGSIMQAHYCESPDRCGKSIDRARALSDDDIEAVCALYPPGPESKKSASCAVTPRREERPGLLPLVSLLAVVLPLLRRMHNTRK